MHRKCDLMRMHDSDAQWMRSNAQSMLRKTRERGNDVPTAITHDVPIDVLMFVLKCVLKFVFKLCF